MRRPEGFIKKTARSPVGSRAFSWGEARPRSGKSVQWTDLSAERRELGRAAGWRSILEALFSTLRWHRVFTFFQFLGYARALRAKGFPHDPISHLASRHPALGPEW